MAYVECIHNRRELEGGEFGVGIDERIPQFLLPKRQSSTLARRLVAGLDKFAEARLIVDERSKPVPQFFRR
jgi:hypothetical protein